MRLHITTYLATTLCITLIAALGCGPTRPQTYPATGEVIYQDKPVEGASVTFSGAGGAPASGLTDASGRFQMRTFVDGDGALSGTHKVTVVKNVSPPITPDNPYPESKNQLPARYARSADSRLTAKVSPTGENHFRFELTDD